LKKNLAGRLFVTELVVKQGNNIQVFIDSDHGVSVDDCIALSRHIESNLDREKEDLTCRFLQPAWISH
jgi:ribosome maturation factor RimP